MKPFVVNFIYCSIMFKVFFEEFVFVTDTCEYAFCYIRFMFELFLGNSSKWEVFIEKVDIIIVEAFE